MTVVDGPGIFSRIGTHPEVEAWIQTVHHHECGHYPVAFTGPWPLLYFCNHCDPARVNREEVT